MDPALSPQHIALYIMQPPLTTCLFSKSFWHAPPLDPATQVPTAHKLLVTHPWGLHHPLQTKDFTTLYLPLTNYLFSHPLGPAPPFFKDLLPYLGSHRSQITCFLIPHGLHHEHHPLQKISLCLCTHRSQITCFLIP